MFDKIMKRSTRPGRNGIVPRLEALEDRTVPSGSYVFHGINDPNAGTTGDGVQGTFAYAINESGLISGNYGDASDVTHSFLLSKGRYITLNDPSAGTAAGEGTADFGINEYGQMVGTYIDSSNVFHGFLLTNGRYFTIDDPHTGTGLFDFNEASGINIHGQVVGEYTDASGVEHGYLESGGVYTTLDDPNGVNTFASGINDSGQIVGGYVDASGATHGFLLSGGQYTTLNVPGAVVGTFAQTINASGEIVGTYVDTDEVYQGFLLSHGQYTTLNDPNAGIGFLQGTFATGINNSGEIAGNYYDANGLAHGYLATLSASGVVFSSSPGAGGTANARIAGTALRSATLPEMTALTAASNPGANRSLSLGGEAPGQFSMVPSSLRTDADNAGDHAGVTPSAAATTGDHSEAVLDLLFTGDHDLFAASGF